MAETRTLTVKRAVTVSVNGSSKQFAKGVAYDFEGKAYDGDPGVYDRLVRSGAFGDSKSELDAAKADKPDLKSVPSEPATADVDKMTVDELRAYAEANSIDLDGADRKADILAKIKAAQAA